MLPYISLSLAIALALEAQYVTSQVLGNPSDLPDCWQRCFKAADGQSCESWDLKCICAASNGSLLSDAITCGRMNCQDSYFDPSSLLVSLQLACASDGVSIASVAITDAENAATTALASAAPSITGLQTYEPIYMTPPSVFLPPYTYTTRTVTTTNDAGDVVLVEQPLTIMPSTVVGGYISIVATLTTDGAVRITAYDGTTINNYITSTRTSLTTPGTPASASTQASETGLSTSSAAVGSVSTAAGSVPTTASVAISPTGSVGTSSLTSTRASSTSTSSATTQSAQNTNGSPFSDQNAAVRQQPPFLLAMLGIAIGSMIN